MNNWPEKKINTWNDFINIIHSLNLETDYLSHWAFRGQPNSEWTLKPGLARILSKYKIQHLQGIKVETTLIREFESNYLHFNEVSIPNYKQNRELVYMSQLQHYGCPTRFLDWTESPYVAMYFAVSTDFENDSALFLFNQSILSERNNQINVRDQGYLTIQEESSHIQTVQVLANTLRSRAQQGIYTIAANCDKDHYHLILNPLKELIINDKAPLLKLVIPKELKLEFLARLRKMNIKSDQLFPDIFGFAKSLKDLIEIRCNENTLKI